MKTKEELTALKEEVETVGKKLAELSEDELVQVVGGRGEHSIRIPDSSDFWWSWNPNFLLNSARPDKSSFIDSDDYIEKETF